MNIPEYRLQNENGSVMIVAVVILVLITIMGLSVTRLSDVDIQISKNEREYVESFYVADSAWREAIQWLDTRASVPGLVNKTLFITNDSDDEDYDEQALNVRNYGDGDEGEYEDYQDGILGSINYWYKIAYLNEGSAMTGTKAPKFGEGFRQYGFRITSVANGNQRVDVTVTKVFKTGE